MLAGVILNRQNVLNEIASLSTNMESSAGDKRSRTYYKRSRPCPTLSQYTGTESFRIPSPVGMLLFYFSEFCLLYGGMGCVAVNNYMYLPYLVLSKLRANFSPISDKRSDHKSLWNAAQPSSLVINME